MRASEIKKSLMMMIGTGKDQKITPFLIGKPGVGKSHIIKQVANELGYEMVDVRLSQIESSDLKGIPAVNKETKTSNWYAPEFLPFKGNRRFEGTKGFLFLDELSRAQPDVLQAVFELIYDYKVGDHILMDNWYVVAAGNMGLADGTDVLEFDTAMNDRLCYLQFDANLDEWVDWAEKNSIRSEIIGFVKTHPKYFYLEDRNDNRNITPRRWAQFSNVIDDNTEMDIRDVVLLLGNSMIGSATPIFLQYLSELKSISGKDVLTKFNKVKGNIEKMELARMTQLVDQVVEELKTIKKSTKKMVDNLYGFAMLLQKDLLVAFWGNISIVNPDIGTDIEKAYPEFDKELTKLIIRSINGSSNEKK